MVSPAVLPQFDEVKLNEFMGKAVVDMGAALHAVLIVLGDRLGLYKAMSDGAPLTPAELAAKTGTNARSVREWLNANAASGYIHYDASSDRYNLPPEQALALAVENSPAFLPGAFQIIASCFHDLSKTEDAFRSGKGVGWHEHHHDLFVGTERFFRPGYTANLVSSWIPALDGVQEKLVRGALVADVGCGLGSSTILMAKAFPKSTFIGFDYHEGSINLAREAAERAGVQSQVRFDVAQAMDYPGTDYDLVTFFDCLHDMGDPIGAATHVASTLRSHGTWMIVEPYAEDSTEKNLNPVGRIFYSASTLLCVPASMSQPKAMALGAQAGEKRIEEVVRAGGFPNFRRAAQTPFNLIFEART
jgi:2-polyprenyl-3-methyl-5-hydroxy-6-metoxy-1,4-benzoquinol methylase